MSINLLKWILLVCLYVQIEAVSAQYCAKIPYTESGGKMMVKVKVDGVDGNFIFDTGAPVCLTHRFATRVKTEMAGEVKTQDSNGGIINSKVVVLPGLLLGGVEFSNVQAVVMDQGNMVENFGVDGIVGYTLFGDKIVEIDSRKKCITIAGNEDFFSLNPAWAMPMLPGVRAPLIVVGLNGQAQDTVMFDSGAGGFYDLSEKTYRRLESADAWILLGRGHGILSLGAGGLEDRTLKYRVRIPTFTLGIGKFTRVVSVTTSGADSRLGAALLNFGSVTIDYRTRKFYFQPYGNAAVDMDQKDWNVVITVMDNELKAGFIWESMWDQLDGGEKIVEVNGKRFDKVDAWQAMSTNLVGLSGEKAELIVLDKEGKEKKVTISKE